MCYFFRVIKDRRGKGPGWFLEGITIKGKDGDLRFTLKKWVWKGKNAKLTYDITAYGENISLLSD